MLELRSVGMAAETTQLSLGFGGDTLNTALYLARLGVSVEYVTALGDDARSDWLLSEWQQEGIGTDHVVLIPGRRPGLYWITTDQNGERSFDYWRGESAARLLFEDEANSQRLSHALSQCGVVYFSGITLSIYTPAARDRLFTLLATLRGQGVVIGFDGNYRPAGWPSPVEACDAFERACRLADIVLPTFDDERALFGDQTPHATLARLSAWGVPETVLKLGAEGCLIRGGGVDLRVATEPVTQPVDTTAAGDSFSAGYLAARYRGESMEAAAHMGNRLAGTVIMHPGAVIPRAAMPDWG
jgi:2-dehydro-3-deoxygluconokinase